MGYVHRAIGAGVLSFCALACAVAQHDPALPESGDAYRGAVSAQVLEPGLAPGEQAVGTGRAEWTDLGDGRWRLEVEAHIKKPGDAGFSLTGPRTEGGWSGGDGNLRLAIDGDGRISGGGTAEQMRVVFSGRAVRDAIDLRVELESLARSKVGVFPVGTRTVFDYALQRASPPPSGSAEKPRPADDGKEAKTAGAPGGKDQECRRTEWRPRNVATFGGPMNMVWVPHCVP